MDALQVGKLTSTKKMLCIDTVICFFVFFLFHVLVIVPLESTSDTEQQCSKWKWTLKTIFCFLSFCVNGIYFSCVLTISVLTLLVGWQEWHPACKKLEWWCANMVTCLEQGADLRIVQLMPLPLTVFCFSKIRTKGRWTGVCLLRLLVSW